MSTFARRWIAGALGCAIFCAATGCSTERVGDKVVGEVSAEQEANERGVALVVESHLPEANPEVRLVRVRLINPTSSTIRFLGYPTLQPWTSEQRWSDATESWEPIKMIRCGFNVGKRSLEPGRSSICYVNCRKGAAPVRVGVHYSIGEARHTVWSDKIEWN